MIDQCGVTIVMYRSAIGWHFSLWRECSFDNYLGLKVMLVTTFGAFTPCKAQFAARAITFYKMVFFRIKRPRKMPTVIHAPDRAPHCMTNKNTD